MSGLSYICEYSDSEDELDASECKNKVDFAIQLKKTKLPLPNLNKVPVVKFDQHLDDPAKHGGRIRTFPHERGNWSTFVYIQYPNTDLLSKIIEKLEVAVLFADTCCQRYCDFHISLSKTLVLKYHMICSLNKSLQEAFNNIESFDLGFDSVAVYCNEEKTRTFVALKVDIFGEKHLLRLAAKVDTVLTDYKLPTFYDEPSFHMSVLDINGNKKAEILNVLENLNNVFLQEEAQNTITVTIKKIDCKSGNKHFQYYLN